MKKLKSTFFQRARGTRSLTMLARHLIGRRVLFEIVQQRNLKICLFSSNVTSIDSDQEVINITNPLVVLIAKNDFGLYKLLLNKIILDSPKIDGQPLSLCIIEALMSLQKIKSRGKKNEKDEK